MLKSSGNGFQKPARWVDGPPPIVNSRTGGASVHKGAHGLGRRGPGWARAAPDVRSELQKVRFYKGVWAILDRFPHLAEMANLKMANS